jgi:hypothetical protein
VAEEGGANRAGAIGGAQKTEAAPGEQLRERVRRGKRTKLGQKQTSDTNGRDGRVGGAGGYLRVTQCWRVAGAALSTKLGRRPNRPGRSCVSVQPTSICRIGHDLSPSIANPSTADLRRRKDPYHIMNHERFLQDLQGYTKRCCLDARSASCTAGRGHLLCNTLTTMGS